MSALFAATRLSIAVLIHDDAAYLDPLYAYGADINSVNDRGETPLHRATLRDNANAVRWLLDRQCDIDCTDKLGYTAFHLSLINNSRRTMRVLLDAGCRTSMQAKSGRTPLHDAAAHANAELLWDLAETSLDAQEIDMLDDADMTIEDVFNNVRHVSVLEDAEQRLDSFRALQKILQATRGGKTDFCRSTVDLVETQAFFHAARALESSP